MQTMEEVKGRERSRPKEGIREELKRMRREQSDVWIQEKEIRKLMKINKGGIFK